ncbi:hypothetical protein [Kitasatospora sp. GAS1066B]|uniref:hypothetical protein n=1 Tax=Kitasatospora sp. GAS1066B TaxID=3156271 RepID=UPI003518352F
MTPDPRSLGLPAFSEPAAAPTPVQAVQAGGHRLQPVEQGADFRQPPGEEIPEPGPVRRLPKAGGPTFSHPDRQI